MHVFGIAVLFGLGVLAVTMFFTSVVNLGQELRAITLVGVGIGLAWAVNFNLWFLWGFPARAGWIALTLSGMILGGIGLFFSAILSFFFGLARMFHDKAATLEETEHVRGLTSEGIAATAIGNRRRAARVS